jgi:hypothetical protein
MPDQVSQWETLLPILVGGGLALLGGVIGALLTASLQAKYARLIRKRELTGERQVDAERLAYARIKAIEGLQFRATTDSTYRYLLKHEGWLWENRLYLPGAFVRVWLDLRRNLRSQLGHERENSRQSTEYQELRKQAAQLVKEAISEIYKETGHESLAPQERSRIWRLFKR